MTPEQLAALRAVPLMPGMRNRLRAAMAICQVRNVDLAEATGLPAPSVSDIVNGKYTDLMVGTAQKFADVFGCAIEDLFPKAAA